MAAKAGTLDFVELNYQGSKSGTDQHWGVHVAGCSDIKREVRQGALTNRIAAGSMRELLDKVCDDECRRLGYGDDNVYLPPCVTTALRAAGVSTDAGFDVRWAHSLGCQYAESGASVQDCSCDGVRIASAEDEADYRSGRSKVAAEGRRNWDAAVERDKTRERGEVPDPAEVKAQETMERERRVLNNDEAVEALMSIGRRVLDADKRLNALTPIAAHVVLVSATARYVEWGRDQDMTSSFLSFVENELDLRARDAARAR